MSPAWLPLLLALTLTAPGRRPAELVARRAMQRDLRKILRRPAARRGVLGVVIKRLGGPVLFARRARRRFHPASCTKILTAAAALRTLGADFRFDTVLLGSRTGSQLTTPLYVWGQGDPALTHEDLAHFASALRQSGIRSIPKGIAVDDSYFSRRRFPPGYGKPDDSGYAAPTGAVAVDGNRVVVTVSAAGSPCRVTVDILPSSDYVEVRNRARCGSENRLDVSALKGRDKTIVVVTGTLKPGVGPIDYSRRIFHPSLFVGSVFRRLLLARGIQVGPVRRVRRRPSGLQALLRHHSPPLKELVVHMNHKSDNFYAEQILRAVGAKVYGPPGTTTKGLRVVAALLGRSGIRPGTYRLTNGSGLFGATALSPRQLVRVLEHLFTLPWLARAILESLPLAGRTGTLAKRPMGHAYGRVRAKTGTLRGVSCLAGYVLDRAGRPKVVFAIMHNGFRGSVKPSRRIQDAIADRVARYLDEAAGLRPRPAVRPRIARPSPGTPEPRRPRPGPGSPAPRTGVPAESGPSDAGTAPPSS